MSRLIENRDDPRFKNIQERIDKAILYYMKKGRIACLQVKDVSALAQIYNSTFYNHFLNFDDAYSRLESKMLPRLKVLQKEVTDADISLENIYRKILFFVYKYQEYYGTMLFRKYATPLLQIPETFRPNIKKGWSNYNKELNEQIFQIFSWEFCGVIYNWGLEEKFDQTKIDYYAKKLTKLTKSACDRLA